MSFTSNQVFSYTFCFSLKITWIWESLLSEILLFWLLFSPSQGQSLNPNEFFLLLTFHSGAVFPCHCHHQSSNLIIAWRSYFNIFQIGLQSLLFPIHVFYTSRFIFLKYFKENIHFLKSQIYMRCAHIVLPDYQNSPKEKFFLLLRYKSPVIQLDSNIHNSLMTHCLYCIHFCSHVIYFVENSVLMILLLKIYPPVRLTGLFHLVSFSGHSELC